MTAPDFDRLFDHSDDPWGYRTRWYERRKRDLTLAALPRERYARGFEPGCANGELSAALATRCDALVVADATVAAVELARARLAPLQHVQVQACRVPDAWPEGSFDLIVISELAYYLAPELLPRLAALTASTLRRGGTVLACHWRPRIADARQTGDEVHARLGERIGLPWAGGWVDADFRIDVWADDNQTVAEREGLRDAGG